MARMIHILFSVMAMALQFCGVLTYLTSPARMPLFLKSPQQFKERLKISKIFMLFDFVEGDLSYANMHQPKWDTFGLLVQPLASKRPWMVTQGNHEIERIRGIHRHSFTSYNARWVMPYEESGSPSNLFYSFEVAGVHVIMLGSYADFGADSAQYRWLKADLRKVDRRRTPWLIAVVHAPWYNSNDAHQGEYQSVGMKSVMEDVLYRARVDVVFAGHVHAYERFVRVYKDKANECGPVHITTGAGGNREGLAMR
ncbi:hypothetical protein Pfo_028481 [Paulownia fortunei]|nr:hypothetical protein Pfo_028481 [Paulownia fortunei]